MGPKGYALFGNFLDFFFEPSLQGLNDDGGGSRQGSRRRRAQCQERKSPL